MTKEEIEKRADKIYPNANVDNHQATEHQGFVRGAMWMQEQFENNRIVHCESMTEEEYKRESEFVDSFIIGHHRTPTFSDAIEITRKQMIDKACEWLQNYFVIEHQGMSASGYMIFEKMFKKAMEE